ncbi:hypothetical protein CRG98_042001 [Punica granatum]|uniref:Uncharacterized protein n=1 Tax=Punica granatum TaxID=22663 RepID=A0A2I0I175_PUNGR|nr:hypothetical protein CRG98_042001 [Punica granatum]
MPNHFSHPSLRIGPIRTCCLLKILGSELGWNGKSLRRQKRFLFCGNQRHNERKPFSLLHRLHSSQSSSKLQLVALFPECPAGDDDNYRSILPFLRLLLLILLIFKRRVQSPMNSSCKVHPGHGRPSSFRAAAAMFLFCFSVRGHSGFIFGIIAYTRPARQFRCTHSRSLTVCVSWDREGSARRGRSLIDRNDREEAVERHEVRAFDTDPAVAGDLYGRLGFHLIVQALYVKAVVMSYTESKRWKLRDIASALMRAEVKLPYNIIASEKEKICRL